MRVLILTADIGAGHDLPARAIRDQLLDRMPDAHVRIVDAIEVAGPLVRALVRGNAERVVIRAPWLFDLQYRLVARWSPTRRLASRLGFCLAGGAIQRLIAAERPDVIVSTYPGANEIVSRLRLAGRLEVPVVSAISDLAALWYWAHRGCDLHLVIHPESAAEIRGIAGPQARIEAVRGITIAAFDTPRDRGAARSALGLPADGPVVVVSGGGWGVGDLRGAVAAALAAGESVTVVALCGSNAQVLSELERTFAAEPRVHPQGFTDRMPEYFAAADVLIHATAGLTVFEALVRGVRVISFGWGVGHIHINNEAYRRFGLADVVADAADLPAAVRRALGSPGRPDLAYGRRPAAADLIIALARGDDGV